MASPVQSLPEVGSSIAEMDTFPFRRRFEPRPVDRLLGDRAERTEPHRDGPGRDDRGLVRQAPELGRPIEDLSVFARHRELVETC